MGISIGQTLESSVDAYLTKILEAQADVDACASLVDAECTFTHQRRAR
jgi:hypothetical protein